jgi:hypothetical protein
MKWNKEPGTGKSMRGGNVILRSGIPAAVGMERTKNLGGWDPEEAANEMLRTFRSGADLFPPSTYYFPPAAAGRRG